MKLKKLLPLLFLFLFSVIGFAQNKEKKENIQALKSTFFTTELSLTPEQTEKFWTIYKAYDDRQFEMRHNRMKQLMRKIKNGSAENMNEKEAALFLRQLETVEDDIYQNRKKLTADLKPIIGSVKIIKLKKAEDDFNRKLLKQYRYKKG